jgi:hypothetical protein
MRKVLIFVVFMLSMNVIGAFRSRISVRFCQSRLYARVARDEKGEKTQMGKLDEREDVEVPVGGLAGNSEGRVFNKPLQTFDPMEDTASLPGEDGSDQKIAAIQSRIQQRVDELKRSGEWGEEGDEYGQDPLRDQSIFTTMAAQVKTCKPFESFDDLLLTYALVLVTTVTLGSYLIFLRESLDTFILWFTGNDFDQATSIINKLR